MEMEDLSDNGLELSHNVAWRMHGRAEANSPSISEDRVRSTESFLIDKKFYVYVLQPIMFRLGSKNRHGRLGIQGTSVRLLWAIIMKLISVKSKWMLVCLSIVVINMSLRADNNISAKGCVRT